VTRAPIDTLVEEATAGDEGAWRELSKQVESVLDQDATAHLTPRSLAELRRIVGSVTERLRALDMARLRLFLAMREDYPLLAFDTWIRVLARGAKRR
jgi:hypothetical protein